MLLILIFRNISSQKVNKFKTTPSITHPRITTQIDINIIKLHTYLKYIYKLLSLVQFKIIKMSENTNIMVIASSIMQLLANLILLYLEQSHTNTIMNNPYTISIANTTATNLFGGTCPNIITITTKLIIRIMVITLNNADRNLVSIEFDKITENSFSKVSSSSGCLSKIWTYYF